VTLRPREQLIGLNSRFSVKVAKAVTKVEEKDVVRSRQALAKAPVVMIDDD
jgi:hypothetical protein